MMNLRFLRRALALTVPFAMIGGLALAQQGGGPGGPGGGGPRQVGVTTLERQTVPVTVTLPGRAVAYHQTAIRPQVGGEITEIAYEPGQRVSAGQVLFRLDDDQLAATLSAAQAAVTSAEAALQGAQATVNRYDRLQNTGVSRADLESAQVALANARASQSAAESERDLARLAVERAEIRSPIDGVTDIAAVSVGDLVTANQSDPLTTVTQLDPIYVDVAESRARFLRNVERQQQGTLLRGNGLDAKLILETGQVYAEGGTMVTPGIAVSATTGTVPFRLEFPNPDRQLLPGQFVRVQLGVGMVDGVLVPQRATRRSAAGVLTAFVAQDGKAHQVELTEAGTHQNAWIVTEGVKAGDQLLLDGLNNMTDGAEITTVPVVIDADGVVREVGADGQPLADAAGAEAATSDAAARTGGAGDDAGTAQAAVNAGTAEAAASDGARTRPAEGAASAETQTGEDAAGIDDAETGQTAAAAPRAANVGQGEAAASADTPTGGDAAGTNSAATAQAAAATRPAVNAGQTAESAVPQTGADAATAETPVTDAPAIANPATDGSTTNAPAAGTPPNGSPAAVPVDNPASPLDTAQPPAADAAPATASTRPAPRPAPASN